MKVFKMGRIFHFLKIDLILLSRLMRNIILLLFFIVPVFSQNWFQSRLIQKQLDMAVEHFNEDRFATTETILNKLLEKPLGAYESTAKILLLKTTYALRKTQKTKEIGREFLQTFPTDQYIKDVFLKFGDIFIDEENFGSAFRMYIRARSLANDDEFLALIDERLLQTIQLNIAPDIIAELLMVETGTDQRTICILANAFNDIASGYPDKCALTLYSLHPEQVPVAYYDLYEKLLRASYEPPTTTVTVGVVLPLSGDNMMAGNSFLRGMYKAIQLINNRDQKIALIIKDNRGSEIETIRAVNALERNPAVKAIIGPISTTNALVAANTVQGKNIPLLVPSSTQDGLASLGSNIYQLNSNLQMRGKIAARYVAKTLKLDSLAVLAPADKFGHALADAFVNEADLLGKKIVAVEWYSGTPTDLKRQFKSLRKVAFNLVKNEESFEEYLGMEFDSLDFLFELTDEDLFDIPEDEDQEVLTAFDSAEIDLNTIQALYLPVHPEHLAYIGTQFPIYHFNTQIVGNESWQDLDVLNRKNIGPHMNGLAIIAGNYSVNIKDEIFQQALECTKLLHVIFNDQDNGRVSIAQRLSNLFEFHGDSKIVSFSNANPNLNTALQVLRYRNGQITRTGFFKGDSFLSLQGIAP